MDWTIETVYIGCSMIGGSILAIQLLLLVFGGDFDADVDADVDVTDGFGLLSVRSIAGFLTFFGLSGWWGSVAEWGPVRTLAVATGAGLAMMLVVAWMLSMQKRLNSQGNIDPQNAVGKAAKVYLRIPAQRSGKGKITVSIQGRSEEFQAVTAGPELPTGSEVRIQAMTTADTFEVVSLNDPPA